MAENINDRLVREWTDGLIDPERAPDGTTIPVPVEDLASLVRAVKALKSAVDQLTGRTGTAYDKPLTLRDLVNGGLSSLRVGNDVIGSGGLGISGNPSTIVPANPDGPGYQDPRPVLATPPVLTNVTANGAFRNVIVVWKRPEYRNHAYVEVWRAGVDNLSLAVRIGTTTANIFADATGAPNTTYWYWVRAVNIEGVIGPFNAVPGTPGTLAPLVAAEVPPQFIAHAMIGLLAVDDANVANLSAAKVTFGEMSGDRIAVNTLHGDKITVNTLLGNRLLANSVTSDKVNGYNLRVMSGGYSGFAWPPPGQFGFYLGPEGLLLGNANNGQYFQVNLDGSIYAPGLTIAGGSASFSGSITAGATITAPSIVGGTVTGATVSATTINGGTVNSTTLNGATGTFSGTLTASAVNAVNTINIAGEAVTVPRGAYTAAAMADSDVGSFPTSSTDRYPSASAPIAQSVAITTHGQKVAIQFGCVAYHYYVMTLGATAEEQTMLFALYRDGTLLQWWAHASLGSTTTMPVYIDQPAAGTYTYTVRVSTDLVNAPSQRWKGVYARGMLALECQR